MAEDKKLTQKQMLFCELYVECGNATEAYHQSYGNKNRNTAGVEGHKLLKKEHIQKYIDELNEKLANEKVASAQEILESLTTIARSNEEKTQDRMRALELLGKTKLLFTDKVQVDNKMEIEIILDGLDEETS